MSKQEIIKTFDAESIVRGSFEVLQSVNDKYDYTSHRGDYSSFNLVLMNDARDDYEEIFNTYDNKDPDDATKNINQLLDFVIKIVGETALQKVHESAIPIQKDIDDRRAEDKAKNKYYKDIILKEIKSKNEVNISITSYYSSTVWLGGFQSMKSSFEKIYKYDFKNKNFDKTIINSMTSEPQHKKASIDDVVSDIRFAFWNATNGGSVSVLVNYQQVVEFDKSKLVKSS